MKTINATLIGLGPRGLTGFDRLVEAYSATECRHLLTIHIVDPGLAGQGVHRHRQPNHLLINTISGMVTMFPKDGIAGAPWRDGPSFPEWARQSGYRRFGRTYARSGPTAGVTVSDHDYLPRAMLGEYLSWYYDRIIERVPAGVRVVPHRCKAVDLEPADDDAFVVSLEDGSRIETDFLFLAAGHGIGMPDETDRRHDAFVRNHRRLNANLAFIRDPYPVEQLSGIAADAVVAVQGMGLTSYDVISQLTIGRGGEFSEHGDGLIYVPSGDEPRLRILSRTGLPYTARGLYQKGAGGLYEARFFTPAAVAAVRRATAERTGSEQIDFDADLLPLLLKEMAYVHASTTSGEWSDPSTYRPSTDALSAMRRLLFPLEGRRFATAAAYRDFFFDHLASDLVEASRGNVADPVKAAIEVIRDARAALRVAVEQRGLTPASHKAFHERLSPAMNRVTFGPPMQRNHELIALRAAGILDLAGGPGSTVGYSSEHGRFLIESTYAEDAAQTEVDVLISARVDAFHLDRDGSDFFRNVLRRGLMRPFKNGDCAPGGIDIDRSGHPVAADGRCLRRVWVTGYPTEGPNYYTHALPLPLLPSRHVTDADNAVLEFFAMAESKAAGTLAASRGRIAQVADA